MGWGDDIMAAGEAKRLADANPGHKVIIGPQGGIAPWSIMWEGLDFIARSPDCDEPLVWLGNYTGKRPYIDYVKTTNERMVYAEGFRAEPGVLAISDAEKAWAARRLKGIGPRWVLIEPNTKGTFGGNKAWPWKHWQELCRMLARDGIPMVQAAPVHTPEGVLSKRLDGPRQITTPNIRQALGILWHAPLLVTTDGALHHAAAALDKKAVVVWGGRTSPSVLGYANHDNLIGAADFCGAMVPCEHCRKAMASITPEIVHAAILRQLT